MGCTLFGSGDWRRLVKLELGLHSLHFGFGWAETALTGPIFVNGEKMDVGVGYVNADDFDHGALAENILEMASEFFDGGHDSGVIFVAEVVYAVDFDLRDDKGVARSLRGDVEEGKSAIVFVDFVTRDFALDNFGENTAHKSSPVYLLYYNIFLVRCMY